MIKQLLLILPFYFILLAVQSQNKWYVATDGNNTNNGLSLATPFLTIQKAASSADVGDSVFVRAGTYRESVVPTNSGVAGFPIVYLPYNSESVTISGCNVVTGFTNHSGNIYKAPMIAGFLTAIRNQTSQVFVNGEMMPLARWPNNATLDPSYPTKNSCTGFTSKNTVGNVTTGVMQDTKIFTKPPTAGRNVLVGAEIYFQPNNGGWSWLFTGRVTAVTASTFTFTSFNSGGKDGSQSVYDPNSRYYMYNKLQLLDTAGEWFQDKTAGLLYLWAPGGVDPSTLTVEAKRREYAFNLSDKSYIEIKGFNLFACSITTDIESGGNNVNYAANGDVVYPWRGKCCDATSNNCVIDGINAKYLSHYTDVSGFLLNQWTQSSGIVLSGSDHIAKNCTIQYSAGNGISMIGYRHKAMYNNISDVNYMATGCSGVNTGMDDAAKCFDFEIGYNTIKRTGKDALTLRGVENSVTTNFVTRVHHNDCSEFMIQDDDGGGIYFGKNKKFVRIDHNKFHDARGFLTAGIYPDFGSSFVLDHNMVWNVESAFHLQGDFSNVLNAICYNNTLVVKSTSGAPYGPFIYGGSAGTASGSIFQNNIALYLDGTKIGAGTQFVPSPGFSVYSGKYNNLAEYTRTTNLDGIDPKFSNFLIGDLNLTAGSPAIDAGTLMTAVVRDGINIPAYNDVVIGAKVDIGALEYSTTLPVSFIGFTTQCVNNRFNCKWNTGAENNVDFYEVQTSRDGIQYNTAGVIKAAGLQTGNRYNFDLSRLNSSNISYMRIVAVDKDNTRKYSKVVYVKPCSVSTISMSATALGNLAKIYISSTELNKENVLQIITLDGKVINSRKINILPGTQTVEYLLPSKGIYLIKLQNAATQYIYKLPNL